MSTSLYQYGVIFQDGSNQTTASPGPNRNMIINGAMRIDQRNAAANAWTNSEVYYVNKTSGLPPVGTTSDGISITGLQLEPGASATEYEITDIGTELAECQRYYRKVIASTRAYSALTNTAPSTVISFSSMRAIPTATIVAGSRANATVSVVIADESSAGHRCGSTAAGTTVAEGDIILLSAEL